jgi:hypothetical protein
MPLWKQPIKFELVINLNVLGRQGNRPSAGLRTV